MDRGGGSILLLALLDQFGIGLPHVFYSKESIIFYLIGGFIGKHYFDGFVQKRNASVSRWAILIFVASLTYSTLALVYPGLNQPLIFVINLTIRGLSFWIMCDLFMEKIPQKHLFQNSFLVYAMHLNIMSVITKLLYLALPDSYLWALPNFIITAVLTLSIIEIFCVLLQKYLPVAYRILSGERNVSSPSGKQKKHRIK